MRLSRPQVVGLVGVGNGPNLLVARAWVGERPWWPSTESGLEAASRFEPVRRAIGAAEAITRSPARLPSHAPLSHGQRMETRLTDTLCTRCGLCCDGTLFAEVELARQILAVFLEGRGPKD